MTDWEDIHPDFTGELQKEWEDQGFDYYDCKGYIDKGLKPKEADFAAYLYYQGYYFYGSGSLTGWSEEKTARKIKELREKYSLWKSADIASEFVFQWQNTGFAYEQIKEWLEAGLKPNDYEFAAYLRGKNYTQQTATANLDQLRREFNTWRKSVLAQEYLNCCYPKAIRKSIKVLDIKDKNLTGSLDLSDFGNLEILDCWGNQLTDLKLDNCRQLRILNCNDNQLTNLDLTNLNKLEGIKCSNNYLRDLVLSPFQTEQLTYLYAENNNFTSQDCSVFKKCVNLKELKIGSHDQIKINQGIYNRFTGSLEPLRDLDKLEYLDISNTDITSGLEYLSEDIEKFDCSTKERPEAKVREIAEDWEYFKRDLKKCKEFINSPTQQWLDQNYPENGTCQRETNGKGWDGSYGWNNLGRERTEIKKLDISQQNLSERLKLKGFTNLRHLNCSNNQLTYLDLRECKSLSLLKCDKNNFESLNFLTPLISLKELDVSDCPNLKGSLKVLEELSKLEKINISHTSITEGLEHLPKNCKELSCNLDYQYGSVEIAKELSKFSHGEGRYDLDKWRIDKANKATASTVPLERLFVIRSNLKQFLNKWGKKDEGTPSNELSKLQSPEQYSKFRYLGGVKWIARGAAVAGGILALTDQATIGGSLAAASPFIDAIASQIEENYYTKREEKWKEFLADADMFLDNYHELLGIIKKIGTGSDLGKINQALKNLNEKTEEFLKVYDENHNKGIDTSELVEKRMELAQDLAKDKKEESRAWEIVGSIKQLEDKVVDYKKKSFLIEEEVNREFKELEPVKPKTSQQWLAVTVEGEQTSFVSFTSSRADLLDASHKEGIEMQNFEQEAKVIQKPVYGIPSSSKK